MTRTVLLGDVCTKVTSGGTPSTKHDDYYGGSIPWLRTQEVGFGNIYSTDKTITAAGLKNSSAKLIPENSVIIAMYGATAGKSAINKIPLTTNQACCNLIIDDEKADYRYVYYYLLGSYEKLLAAATGAAQQNLGAKQIAGMSIVIPELESQKKIADVLGTIDEKIELYRKMNETLEQMGQALFRHYFITNPEAKGVSLEDVATLERGVEPGSKNYSTEKSDGSIPFLRVGDLSQRSSNLFVSTDLTKGKIALPNDILVSFDGAPGLVGIGLSGCYSSGIRKITPKNDKVSKSYLYFLMKSPEVQGVLDRYSEGTTIKHASKSILHIVAPYIANSEADALLSAAFEQMINNIKEIGNLTILRDSLLPRLISGKIKL